MSRKQLPRKLHEEQEEYQERVVGLCVSCQKPVKGGWYGAHGDAGTCSKTCEKLQETQPKYGEHTEEAFLTKFNL